MIALRYIQNLTYKRRSQSYGMGGAKASTVLQTDVLSSDHGLEEAW